MRDRITELESAILAEREKVRLLVKALKEFENEYPSVTRVLAKVTP